MPLVPAYRCDRNFHFVRRITLVGVRWFRVWLRKSTTKARAIEAAELQSDDVAQVDQKSFGMLLAEIIIRVRNLRTPRQRK
jgi:hypothetical protein